MDSFGRDLAKDILIKIYTTLNDKYQNLSVIPREIDSYNKLDMAIENYGLYDFISVAQLNKYYPKTKNPDYRVLISIISNDKSPFLSKLELPFLEPNQHVPVLLLHILHRLDENLCQPK